MRHGRSRGASIPVYALALIVVVGGSFAVADKAIAQSACVYADERGNIKSVRSLKDVPSRFRAKAACEDKQPSTVPNAEDVSIRGGARSASFGTTLGTVEVKWPRQIEQCFGKSPTRAISEASSAANRALRSARFDQRIRVERRDWSFVLIDRANAVSQFPMQLSMGGHPGFMIPPNQIYIVADYISPNCQKSEYSDSLLTQVLLHEMGHVLEYALLGDSGMGMDRKRAEGFASWFEGYSSQYASTIPKGEVQRRYRNLVRSEAGVGSTSFSGGGEDYAIASLEFEAIVSRKGVSGLMDIYETMNSERCSFYEALQRKFGWDQDDLRREVKNLSR